MEYTSKPINFHNDVIFFINYQYTNIQDLFVGLGHIQSGTYESFLFCNNWSIFFYGSFNKSIKFNVVMYS